MKDNLLRLSDIPTGSECVVVKVHGDGRFRTRIMEMGFVKGEKVHVVKNAPLNDPIEYSLMDSRISLRRSEARLVEVTHVVIPEVRIDEMFNGTFSGDLFTKNEETDAKTIVVALVGNPNCGKTSLFNYATGLREKVGNYSGVTVDAKTAKFKHNGYTIKLVDLPGTYSVTEYTPEELFVRQFITEKHPDIVLNVVDASNLERNLYLTTQLIDMNVRLVMALNMYDELEKQGSVLDYPQLGRLLGFPIVPTTAFKGLGIQALLDKVIETYENSTDVTRHINYGKDIEEVLDRIQESVSESVEDKHTVRYWAIKLLEKDQLAGQLMKLKPGTDALRETVQKYVCQLEKKYNEDTQTIFTDAKYGFIRGALKETFTEGEKEKRRLTDAIDTLVTHRWLGFPFLVLFMWVMFQVTFSLGSYPMDWIEEGVSALGRWMSVLMAPGPLNDLLVDGVVAGVGGVLVFLPNILILFFFISLMEDTGYMARAAFIMDKLMHKIGLHGKSFIPLLIGFGCNVPAIMATRTLENRKERIITMLIAPFMSCSARLPVYILLVSAFFPTNQGLILLSIYAIGILLAVFTALVLKKTLFVKQEEPFVMELPPYRMPTVRNTVIHMWDKAGQYLKKMGTVILFASILIWALGYYPRNNEDTRKADLEITALENNTQISDEEREEKIGELELDKKSGQMQNSYIGQFGHFIQPGIAPLGFDWKMGVSIITGLAAKEIVVSSMGILYHVETEDDENLQGLVQNIQQSETVSPDGVRHKVFTPLVAYGFMLFILIYFPCMAVIAAIKKEAGWGWAIFTVFYSTGLAWVIAFAVYQIGNLF